jgi:putative transposase
VLHARDRRLAPRAALPRQGERRAGRAGGGHARRSARDADAGTDNGSAFTARAFKLVLSGLGDAHRRSGYRDPESQAFIESWFSKLKQRCVWRDEFETLDEAREKIARYVDRYHHRPHSRLAYRTPREVAATWKDHDDQLTPAA